MNKNNLKKIFLILLFVVIGCFPKINLIRIPGSKTGIRLDDIMFLIYFVILSYELFKEGFSKYRKLEKITKIFFICIISFLISNIFGYLHGNVSIVMSTLHLIRKIQYFIMIYAGYDYYKVSNDKNSLLRIFKFILIFHFIYLILQEFNLIVDVRDYIDNAYKTRISSTFNGPYEFAGYLLLPIPLLLNEIKERKYFNIFYILLCVVGIFISESRISLVAALIIICLFLFFNVKILYRILLSILSIIMLSFCIINPLKIKTLDRFSGIDIASYQKVTKMAWDTTDYEYYKETGNIHYTNDIWWAIKDLSFSTRISKWTTLIKEAIKTPVFGMGLSLAGEAMDGSFVRLFVETGLVGLILWCILLITIIKESYKFSKNNFLIVLGLIISIVIGSTFIDIFEASKVMMPFWFIIGFIFSYENSEYYKKDKIKVAHIISGMNYGGVENVIYNYYSNMDNSNYENIVICHSKINKNNSKLFKNYNFKFYEVTPKRDSLFRNYKEIKKILKKENVDIVHVHMSSSSFVGLIAAKKVGVRVRICHAHNKEELNNKKGKLLKFICNKFANEYMACSLDACNNLFSKKNRKKCIILSNAINLERFNFDKKVRTKLRKELKLTKKHVIGHVGRLSKEKNHEKLINAFKEILKKDSLAHLLLIGDGEYKKEIKDMIKDIKSSVTLIKNADNIEDYYNVMDVFVFPSINEGLGISVVEAQVSGLSCIVSDTVPQEVKITKLVKFMKLSKSDKEWANEIIKHFDDERKSHLEETKKSNYNIVDEANKLNNIYNEFYNKYI